MSKNRDELLTMCTLRMKRESPERSEQELADDFPMVIDEIIRALQHDAGIATDSPLPGKSETATRHGSQRQRRGYPINKLALDFGAISDSIGELGIQQGLTFGAREYQA